MYEKNSVAETHPSKPIRQPRTNNKNIGEGSGEAHFCVGGLGLHAHNRYFIKI